MEEQLEKTNLKQPAFEMVFERLEKALRVNQDLITACQMKSSKLAGSVPSDKDLAIKQKEDLENTIIMALHSYCGKLEQNNGYLDQVFRELALAI